MLPSYKNPAIDTFIEHMGFPRRASIRINLCAFCGGRATNFRDALSRKEYTISGMCQKCQNSIFDADE